MSATVGAEARPPLRLVCLLPVRNAADRLGEWLDEAGRFADAVVALDDGSTDGTGAILAAHPLVATVITNEPREGFLGWHDGRNRNRLLTAAAALGPTWIFSLDADERLDPTDAVALREFAATEALPGCAYGFQVFRMCDATTYDPDYEWVFRLFAFRPKQRFANRRLDLVPVPIDIGTDRWIATTLRIQHFGEPDAAAHSRRIAKFREADPEGAFRDYYEQLRPPSRGPFPRWHPRPPELPILAAAAESVPAVGDRPYVVCLLPARNCAHLLADWFESVARVADAVVALDDGSVDATRELLEAHPLVARVLTNPPRPAGFDDWDDGHNRNRLLAAAGRLAPTWIISIDADERIPLEDAAALRRFLHRGAEAGVGYALASYRMIGDQQHYDRLDYDAYRLFAYEPGHVFPTDRLHAPPIPTAIPPARWRRTTIRMQHLVSLTAADRRARRDKFLQADPDLIWEPDYEYTIEEPGPLLEWATRPMDLAVLADDDSVADAAIDDLDLDGPALSVGVVVDARTEREVVAWLESLGVAADPDVEVVVGTRDPYAADVIRRDVPDAVVADITPDMTAAGLRNAIVAAARGDYIAFLSVGDAVGDHAFADLIALHDRGNGVVLLALATSATAATDPADLGHEPLAASLTRDALLAAGGFANDAPGGLDADAVRRLVDAGATVASTDAVVCRRLEAVPATRLHSRTPRSSRLRAAGARWVAPVRRVVRPPQR